MLREFLETEKKISSRVSCGSGMTFSFPIMPTSHQHGTLYSTSGPVRGVSGRTPEFRMHLQVNREVSKGLETAGSTLRQQNRALQLVGSYIPTDSRAKVFVCCESVVDNTGKRLLTWNWLEQC